MGTIGLPCGRNWSLVNKMLWGGLPKPLAGAVGSAGRAGGTVGGPGRQLLLVRTRRDCTFAWNCLVAGYANVGRHEDTLALYLQMDEEGAPLDLFTFASALLQRSICSWLIACCFVMSTISSNI
jgi:pentatricopeptide repeat protein